jgi:hypothetical protein
VKQKTLLTLRQKKLLASGDFFTVFHEVHNPHLKMLNTKVGNVGIKTDDKRTYANKKDHGTDITFENEFKVKK